MMDSWVRPTLRGVKQLATMGESGEPRFWALIALIGFFGGSARALLGRNERTRWYDILAAGVVSLICGVGVGCLTLYIWGPQRQLVIIAASSLASYTGLALMDMLSGVAIKSLRQQFKTNEPSSDLSRLFTKTPKE